MQQLSKKSVVVSFSTTPYRINDLQDTINSILDQTYQVDAIYLSIPYIFKRENIVYQIPRWLEEHPKITILRTQDYGPATKLLGLLEQKDLSNDAIIVIIDDDTVYPRDFVFELAKKSLQNPGTAYGVMGANPIYDQDGLIDSSSHIGIEKIRDNNASVSLLQGYMGVVYRRGFFDKEIFDVVNAPQECINSDDFYISYFLARRKIPRKVINTERISTCYIYWGTNRATDDKALHQLIPRPVDKHRVCLKYLQETYPHVAF